MEYAISLGGSTQTIPAEWQRWAARGRELPGQGARQLFVRVVALFNHSAGQHLADALGVGGVVAPVSTVDHAREMCLRALAGNEASLEEKAAVASAWKCVDAAGLSSAATNPMIPAGVRLMLQDRA